MTIDNITSYCQFLDCEVRMGNPEVGFIEINGSGVKRRNNYQRYLSHHEMSFLPSPAEVLSQATSFQVARGSSSRALDRSEFDQELVSFQRKVGIEE